MEPNNVEYLRQLEARVRTLENENKILRSVLKNSNALSENPLVEAPANKHLCSGNSPNRIVEHNAQIESKSHTLTPAAKIQLFRTRFAGRTDLYARRWVSRDGKKKGYAPVCANEWRDGILKSRLFVAMNMIIEPLSLSQMSSCVNI